MKYTNKDGQYYKVVNNGKVITIGILEFDRDELNTIDEVSFITETEYLELLEEQNNKLP